jgi:1,5-anhydro-D-fructose reductase (1,5-anhydro-D-mannitol-forming)
MSGRMNDGSSTRPVAWGLIGTSGWADDTFAPAIVASGATLIGAAGRSAEGSAAFADRRGALRAYAGLDEFLADPDIEAVWVASPSNLHVDHVLSAIRAGKHVLCEKPIATTTADAERLVEGARGARSLTATAFQHRWNPAHRRFRELLRDGAVGSPPLLRLHRFNTHDALPVIWRRNQAESGGWAVNDVGAHMVDLVRWFVGDVGFVGAVIGSPTFGLPTDDVGAILLTTSAGAAVLDLSTGLNSPGNRFEAYGPGGWARLSNSWDGAGELDVNGEIEQFEPGDNYEREVRAFSAAIRGEPWRGATLEDGLQSVRIISQATAAVDRVPSQ